MVAEGGLRVLENFMKFVPKAVPVDAVQWTGRNILEMTSFLKCDITAIIPGKMKTSGYPTGDFEVNISDWVVRKAGVEKPEVMGPTDFSRQYEHV